MDHITKPSITRLARRAGVKSSADNCYDTVRALVNSKIHEIVHAAQIVNSEHQTKTLMVEDVYRALPIIGLNATQSVDIGTGTCAK